MVRSANSDGQAISAENPRNSKLETQMPSVALIGPELYPIPPIRGGAAELFIEKTAARLQNWRPVVIGIVGPGTAAPRDAPGPVEYFRIPLTGWRRWLYCRYRHYFPLYDREVARIVSRVQPDLLHVHNRPLLALFPGTSPGFRSSCICTTSMSPWANGKDPRPGRSSRWQGFIGCSHFVLERERARLGAGARVHRVVYNGVEAGGLCLPVGG